jgi:cell division septal protein FtsQ
MRRKNRLALIFKLISSILVLSLIVTVLLILLRSDFFIIKRVVCLVGDSACPGDYWADLQGLTLGKNIFLLSSQVVEEGMKTSFPDIDKVRINKVFPGELKLVVELRRPVAALGLREDLEDFEEGLATKSADFFITDEKVVIFQKASSPLDFTVILVDNLELINVGQKIDQEQLKQSVSLVTLLSKLDLKPELVRVLGKEIQVSFKEGLEVVFSSEKEASIQVGSLQLILSRTKIEGKSLKRVDLRFDKPVIVEK